MNQHQLQERRNHSRIAFDAPVSIASPDGKWQSRLLDISLKGALVRKPNGWDGENGQIWELDIQLSEQDVHINMEARVMHIDESHIGFHCDHIDLDSVTNLRLLVELNLADEAMLERELASMA